jgi:hypothetical protein
VISAREEQVGERFKTDVENHKLTIAHNDGLYRHLKCRDPETSILWFDIITWPGTLCIDGDMGTYTFRRLPDMFSFFGGDPRINPQYWAEKLQGVDKWDAPREYSHESLSQQVWEYYDDVWKPELSELEAAELQYALDMEVIPRNASQGYESAERAHQALDSFEWKGYKFHDSWEWNLTQYTVHYLWNCHAIPWAIGQYRMMNR